MPHTTATKAFHATSQVSTGGLLPQLYNLLVTIELLAKDHINFTKSTWQAGHDICVMLVDIDGGLSSISAQLKTSIETLICTNKIGRPANVAARSYPDMRYLRHANDSPAWPTSSDDTMLQTALDDALTCLQQLKTLGIAP